MSRDRDPVFRRALKRVVPIREPEHCPAASRTAAGPTSSRRAPIP